MPRKINLDVDQLKTLVNEGKSFPTIMREMNCSRSKLSKTLAALGLKAADGRAERYHTSQTNKLSKKKLKDTITPSPNQLTRRILSQEDIDKCRTHARALGIKNNGGNPDTAVIIASIDMKIEYYQDMIGKLNKAKSLLI